MVRALFAAMLIAALLRVSVIPAARADEPAGAVTAANQGVRASESQRRPVFDRPANHGLTSIPNGASTYVFALPATTAMK